ncbi:hypothetical protein DY000_02022925 [Brassica cretica]|uniref:BZIP domain-containing protein n=1 Tax=Brassica cretica TaxID=69181 RepID=A0ABQ7EDK3_BRACR|nr:hypothetical protein DY000_02022925 [Brassica cretica]
MDENGSNPWYITSTHEITCRTFSTQLRSSSKKNQIKRSSYVPFTNQVIFSSRELRPPEKVEMANLLSDEPTTNSIMQKFDSFSGNLPQVCSFIGENNGFGPFDKEHEQVCCSVVEINSSLSVGGVKEELEEECSRTRMKFSIHCLNLIMYEKGTNWNMKQARNQRLSLQGRKDRGEAYELKETNQKLLEEIKTLKAEKNELREEKLEC